MNKGDFYEQYTPEAGQSAARSRYGPDPLPCFCICGFFGGGTAPLTSASQQLDDESGAAAQTFEVSTSEEFSNAVNAINGADSGSYVIKLENNIALNGALFLLKNTTTILGEGHTLSGTLNTVLGAKGTAVLNLGAENYSETLTFDGVVSPITGPLLTIAQNATLNMYDHVTLQNNSSRGTNGGVQVLDKSTFNMYGGTIQNCANVSSRVTGGVLVYGTFNMQGGTIRNCSAGTGGFGGGIYAEGGTVNITGGSLCENKATYGGAVMMHGGSLNITGGSICKNTASYGGGIVLYSSTNVSIQNCTITDNNAEIGGGIILMQSSSANLSGTGNVVCNNIASSRACDIYLSSANDKLKLFDAASMNRTYRDSGKKIDGWYLDSPLYVPSEDAEAVDVSSELSGELALAASYRVSQEPEIPDGSDAGGAGSVLGSVVAGTAIGVGGYLVGTDFWLNTLYGFVPTNRIQLAEALWNRADCPAPQSNALYSDIAEDDSDAQQAARWCVEQDLMKDCTRTEQDGTETATFKPYGYVFRPQAIGAWYQLDSLLKERT